MNTNHFREILLRKQDELRREVSTFLDEAREAPEDVGDPVDAATSSQEKSTALEEKTVAADTLQQVEAALQRISDGTYGRCIDCGRPIEAARLEAVPWTPYCLADQQKHDKEGPPVGGSTI